jgi:TetR/AcrR family transcriptional repressor of nem operon
MPSRPRDKRTRLVDAAVRLVHRQGFHRTTLAEVAQAADVPLGNVYYYFKTKDELGQALVDLYSGEYDTLRATWDAAADPKARLEAFIQMTADRKDALARSGCPIGTLSSELHKDGGHVAECATRLFAGLLDWAEHQFRLLGRTPAEARGCAVHLLSAVEGASLLAHTFGDPKFAAQEARRLRDWIREMPAR